MSLERLTKIDGGGISTTSDYRVGVITATKFVGPFDGTGGNFSGVVTATNGVFSGNISAVDGNFTGNVTIGGTLTYEDVTNIDSVGIITAQKDIHVGAGVSAVGVGTFSGLDINGDLDVDGHTNLDNVSVAGVSTFSNFIYANQGILIKDDNKSILLGTSDDMRIRHTGSHSEITDEGTGDLRLGSNRTIIGNPTFSEKCARFIQNGAVELYHDNIKRLETSSVGVSIPQDLDVDGHTNLDNVSIAGVTTFNGLSTNDVIRVRSADSNGNCVVNILSEGTTGNSRILFSDTAATSGDGWISYSHNDRALTFTTAGTSNERLRITSGGKVGINSTSPSHTLDVVGGYQALGLYRNDFTGNSGAGIQLSFGRAKANGDLFNAALISAVGSDNTAQAGELRFSVLTSGSMSEKLRITSGGSVNIGVTASILSQTTYKLQVETATNKRISFGTAAHDDLSNEGPGIFFSRQSDGSPQISGIFGHGNTSLGLAARSDLTFHAGGASSYGSAPERLRINSAGTVRIKRAVSTSMGNDSIFLALGDTENGANVNRMIGFGYNANFGTNVYPASMGYTETDNSGHTKGALTFNTRNTTGATDAPTERLRITSGGVISFDQGTTAAVTPSQATATSIGHQTMSGGTAWFNHGTGIDYFGVDGDWKLTNGATYGKIVARNTQGAINNAEQAGHTWFLVCKTVAGTLGNSNWVVEPVAGWKMAWPVPLIAGGVATFYMRDAVESFGSPTIPASGDYYIGWFYSVSQDMGTNGGDYYVDATSGGKIYYYSGEGDMSNPHQRIPRQGDSWDSTMTGEKIHFRFETLPKADLTGTVFASPLLVDPVMEGVPLIDGLPMAGGQLVKDVQWATNVSSVEFMNADFVNCNYLVTYSINGAGTGSNNATGWYQTRLQFCDHDGSFYNGTSDYISHCEWLESDDNGPPTINQSFAGLQSSIWLTGNGAQYDHEGYVWIIPSNFRHNRDSTISQRWTQGTESNANTHPRIFVRGHSFLSTGSAGQHYREEGGGTYRGTNGVFNLSGFRLFGSDSSNYGVPSSIGSSNGYVRIWRFKSGFEAREVS